MITKIKICGITREEDAAAAVETGASALGFVFVKSSPRYVSPHRVSEICRALPPYVATVGVVADSPRDRVMQVLGESGVGALQFHGNEAPPDLQGYPVPAYKAFRVGAEFDVHELSDFPGPAFLLDTFVAGYGGGTGHTFDWRMAVAAKRYGNIILAGGITSANIGRALQDVHPYAVDVSSGVESSPGVKDRRKLRELFAAAAGSLHYDE